MTQPVHLPLLLLIQFLWLIGMLCVEIDIKMENEVLLILLLQITSGGEASNHSFLVSRTIQMSGP